MDNLKPLSLASELGLCKSATCSQCCSNLRHLKPPKGSILAGLAQEQLGRSPAFSVCSVAQFPGFPMTASTFDTHAKHQPQRSQTLF